MRKTILWTILGSVGLALLNGQARAETRIQKTFDQWSVNCAETDKKRCSLSFGLINPKNKRLVFGWSIVPTKDGAGNLAVVRTPIGTLLTTAISVSFANAKPVNVVYKTCGPANCIGEVPFSDAWLNAFTTGTSFTATYAAANGKEFKHEVSLKGFSDGFTYYTAQLAAAGQ